MRFPRTMTVRSGRTSVLVPSTMFTCVNAMLGETGGCVPMHAATDTTSTHALSENLAIIRAAV
jgi:hypothetical protein